MSPIVRIPDPIYKRLESHAKGFDTPSSVIERILDFYESIGKTNTPTNIQEKKMPSPITTNSHRKIRDKEKEKILKIAVGNSLKWGDFKLENDSLLLFPSNKKVLCKYSSFSDEQDRWFWGVPKKYWSNWGDNFYLALIMENQNFQNYSYLLLNSKDAKYLFSLCSESNNEKKINLRIYKDNGLPHIQEWKEYNVRKNVVAIQLD